MIVLTPTARLLLDQARRAVLGTTTADGRARLVPICYWLSDAPDATRRPQVYSALDEKPKHGPDPLRLGRVRDLLARPSVALLVDHWDEAWERLAWVRLDGSATIIAPPPSDAMGEAGEHARAVAGLRARYPQYHQQDLARRPLIRITVEAVTEWRAS